MLSNIVSMEVITQKTFEEVTKNGLVLIDMTAAWCGPCKQLKPILIETEKELTSIKFIMVDIDENMGLAEKFDIVSIPALILFKDGKEIDRQVGGMSKNQLKKWLGKYLSEKEVTK